MSFNNGLLRAVLGCGTMELDRLQDCGYNPFNIVEECNMNFGVLNFNNIIITIFEKSQGELNETIKNEINNLDELEEENKEELKEIRKLDPYKDIDWFINGALDTHLWLKRNVDIYNKYFRDELKEVEKNTGFYLQY